MRKIRYFGVKNIGYLEFNCACFTLLKTFGWNSQVLEQSARELPSKARLQLGVHPPNDQQRYQLVSKLLICNCTSLVQIDLIILFPLPFQRKRKSGEGTKAVKKILADSEDESEEEKGEEEKEKNAEEEVKNKEEENENGIPDKSEDEAPQPSESEEKDEPEEHSEEETPKKKRGSKVSAGKKESAGRARTKKPAAAAKSSPPEKVTQKRSSAKRKKTDDDSDASPKASSKRKKSEKATKAPAPSKSASKEKPGLDFILFIFVFQ